MIGFPLYADQGYNALRIVHKGYGIAMNIYDFTADQLQSNMEKILTDPSYMERITAASDIFRSARERPAERAVDWIEHICRFGGDHLRSAGNDLALYEYLLVDVVAMLCLCALLLVVVIFKIIKVIFRLLTFLLECCRRFEANQKAPGRFVSKTILIQEK